MNGQLAAEIERETLIATTSLRSFVTVDDIANMVLFLASGAGRRISGQALAVDEDIRSFD